MDQQRRVLLAVALCVGMSLAYTQFIVKPRQEADAARLAALDAGPELALSDAGVAPVVVAPATPSTDGGVAEAAAAPAVKAEPQIVTLDAARDTMKLAFTSEGAGLSQATLLGRREHQPQQLSIIDGWKKLFGASFAPPPQMNLAQPSAAAPQLGLSITGAQPLNARLKYEVVENTPGRVVFAGDEGPWHITKTFTWAQAKTGPEAYAFGVDVTLRNTSAATAAGELTLHTTRAITPDEETAPSLFGGIGNQATVLCRHNEEMLRHPPKDDEPAAEGKGPVQYVGIDQQYFLTAIWPRDGAVEGRCALNATTTARSAQLTMPISVAAGETVTKHFGAFLGPKELDLLAAIDKGISLGGVEAAPTVFAPHLDKTVDFSWWTVICKGLLFFLRFFHGLTGNWGVAIILLTVMVKLALLPLTHRQMVSAEAMKKLQPKMEEIKKKFPDDREKQTAEQMRLYQEAKVNPLGGCLPLLLQMPIWIALFTTLRTSYELYGEPFFGPAWTDLTSKDPTYLLPLALGVTMIITQRFQPAMMDKSQAVLMTWVMPVFFTAMMMNYPAGLALYIFTNNLLSIIQQVALRRWLARKDGGGGGATESADKKVRVA